jgi:putative SOS response-associated peptidase YedK
VILAPEDYDAWMNPETPKEAAEALLRPCPEDWLEAYPVSTRVNNVRNEDASLVEPLEEEPAAAAPEEKPRQSRLL